MKNYRLYSCELLLVFFTEAPTYLFSGVGLTIEIVGRFVSNIGDQDALTLP